MNNGKHSGALPYSYFPLFVQGGSLLLDLFVYLEPLEVVLSNTNRPKYPPTLSPPHHN